MNLNENNPVDIGLWHPDCTRTRSNSRGVLQLPPVLTTRDEVKQQLRCGLDHSCAHTSNTTDDDRSQDRALQRSNSESNDLSGPDTTSSSRNPPLHEDVSGGSRRQSVKWTKADEDHLTLTAAPLRGGPAGRIDHKLLLARWDTSRRDGLVSNVPRTANALVAKLRDLQKKALIEAQRITEAPERAAQEANEPQNEPEVATPQGDVTVDGEAGPSQDGPADEIEAPEREADDPINPLNRTEADPPQDESTNEGPPEAEASQDAPADDNEAPEREADDPEEPANPPNDEEDAQDNDGYARFSAAFKENVRLASKPGGRRPLKLTRGRRIPDQQLRYGERAISEYTLLDPLSIGRLNCAVYGAAKTIIDCVVGQDTGSNKEFLTKNCQKRFLLGQNLGKLKSVMDQLSAAQTLTVTQRDNLKALRRKYGKRYKLRTVAQMAVLYHDLTVHLSKCQRLFQTKIAEASRKRTRLAPLNVVMREQTAPSETPIESVRDYWEGIIGTASAFQMNPMLQGWKESIVREVTEKVEEENEERETDLELWNKVCQRAKPFKATGPDGIQTFWWKVFKCANSKLQVIAVELRDNPARRIPSWIAHGRAVSLYKGKGDQKDPGNYRTIACLNTCYKLVTGLMTRWICDDIKEVPSALPAEQMALKKGVWSTTHAHILDRTIVKDCVTRGRPLSIAWIDFAKAFDSVPHKYIVWILETIGVRESVRTLLARLMSDWELTFTGFENGRLCSSRPLKVLNGVLQGDTLSPLLFCLSVSPISHYLNSNLQKYRTSTGTIGGRATANSMELNHLYYVDDLVIYTPSPDDLRQAVTA